MARIPITLAPGLRSNDTSFSTEGAYRFGDHIRFKEGRLETVLGHEKIYLDPIPGIARNLLAWKDDLGTDLIAVGTNSRLMVHIGGAMVDVTPPEVAASIVNAQTGPGYGRGDYGAGPFGRYDGTIATYGIKTWSLQNFGPKLVANPRMGPIYLWQNDPLVKAALLSTVPNANSVPSVVNQILLTEDNQLLALGCEQEFAADGSKPGVFNPLTIRGSEVLGEIWVWNQSDGSLGPANNAFEFTLPNGGAIVGGRNWGEVIAVWTQQGLWRGQLQNDTANPFRFDPIPGAPGLLGPNAAVLSGGTMFWLSPDLELWTSTGGAPSRINCPIHDETLGKIVITQSDKVVVSALANNDEIRIDYPHEDDDLENSRYVMVNTVDGSWSAGVESRTAFDGAKALRFPISARGYQATIPHLGELNTVEQGLTALSQYQRAASIQTNLLDINKLVSSGVGSVVPNLNSQALFGMTFTGNGASNGRVRFTNTGILPTDTISISFQAKVDVGSSAFLTVRLTNNAGIEENVKTQVVQLSPEYSLFRIEGIQMPTNLTNAEVIWEAVGDAILLNDIDVSVIDMKVERSQVATAWVPYPADPYLMALYKDFIAARVYEQDLSYFYYEQTGYSGDGGPLQWSAETNDFALDKAVSNFQVQGFWPDFIGQQGNVYVTFIMRDAPQSPEFEAGPFLVEPGQDRIDFLETAKIFRIRLEGNSLPAALRIGAPAFDAVLAGRR